MKRYVPLLRHSAEPGPRRRLLGHVSRRIRLTVQPGGSQRPRLGTVAGSTPLRPLEIDWRPLGGRTDDGRSYARAVVACRGRVRAVTSYLARRRAQAARSGARPGGHRRGERPGRRRPVQHPRGRPSSGIPRSIPTTSGSWVSSCCGPPGPKPGRAGPTRPHRTTRAGLPVQDHGLLFSRCSRSGHPEDQDNDYTHAQRRAS